jgi:hypothetical protein
LYVLLSSISCEMLMKKREAASALLKQVSDTRKRQKTAPSPILPLVPRYQQQFAWNDRIAPSSSVYSRRSEQDQQKLGFLFILSRKPCFAPSGIKMWIAWPTWTRAWYLEVNLSSKCSINIKLFTFAWLAGRIGQLKVKKGIHFHSERRCKKS